MADQLTNRLLLFIGMHGGFGLLQVALLFFLADISSYGGDAGFWAHTPLGEWFLGDAESTRQVGSLTFIKGLFDFISNLGDTVYGVLAFNYDMLTKITPSDGVVFYFILVIRLTTWYATWKTGAALIQWILSTGVMQSNIGAALVLGGGASTAALTGLGIFN